MPKSGKSTKGAWIDPDDAPELTDEQLDRAAIGIGDIIIRPANGTLTKPGRPRLEHPKRQVTVRLDDDLIERLKAGGPGWQTRINALLRKAVDI